MADGGTRPLYPNILAIAEVALGETLTTVKGWMRQRRYPGIALTVTARSSHQSLHSSQLLMQKVMTTSISPADPLSANLTLEFSAVQQRANPGFGKSPLLFPDTCALGPPSQ